MVFGFFRKPQPPPDALPLPPSPAASSSNPNPSPGPKVRSTSPSTNVARLSIEDRQSSPTRRGSLGSTNTLTAIAPNPVFVAPEPTVEALTAHIAQIPPKTLHAYVLSRIPRGPEEALPTLATFFDELAPPQKLHCVRCHKDFVEVENDDRSCLVPHDDESAEVERVGTTQRANRAPGTIGATFETLWGCCGKLVEGDGDQGPPDGWCYEGKHTTDIKRARFRADSTPHDDKLVSCLRLNCHGIRAQMPRGARSMRKRPRSVNMKEASTEEDESEGGSDSGMDEIVGKSGSTAGKSRPKPKGKGKTKAAAAVADDGEQMDADDDHAAESASMAGSVRGRGRPPKSKTTPGRPPSSSAKRVRVAESKVVPGTDGEDDDSASVKAAATKAPAKRRGRPPKSKPVISDSDREMETENTPASKGKEKEKKSRVRSLSRTRPGDMSDASVAGAKPKSRAKKAREANAKDQEADADGADGDDEKPKKRRKVVEA